MKKGISIWSFPAQPLRDSFALAKDAGYDSWVSAEMIPNYKYFTETIIYNTSNAMDKILGRK